MFAQIGLGIDPTGGIIVLLVGGLLGGLGLVLCVVGGIGFFRPGPSRGKSALLLLLGLIMVSPAAWFAWDVFVPDFPRDKSWDFSASRSVAQLQEKKEVRPHFFRGNIRSSVKLDGGRHWSGHAYLVEIRTNSGQMSEIHWQGYSGDATVVYEQTRRMLKDLALPDRELESWYGKVGRGEQASFGVAARPDTGASVEVQVRETVREKGWTTHVHVWWKDGNR